MLHSIIFLLGHLWGCTSTPPELPRSNRDLTMDDLDFKKVKYGTLSGTLVEHLSPPQTKTKGVVIVTGQPFSFWYGQGKSCLSSFLQSEELGFIISANTKQESNVAEAEHYLQLILSKKSSQHSISVSMEPICDIK